MKKIDLSEVSQQSTGVLGQDLRVWEHQSRSHPYKRLSEISDFICEAVNLLERCLTVTEESFPDECRKLETTSFSPDLQADESDPACT